MFTVNPIPWFGGHGNGSGSSGPVCHNPAVAGEAGPWVPASTRRWIGQMAGCNPLWRAPRIHSEVQMPCVPVSERTVSRILRGLRRPPAQTWENAPAQSSQPDGLDRRVNRSWRRSPSQHRADTNSRPGQHLRRRWRLIGPIQRECLNHMVFLNARHLKRGMVVSFARGNLPLGAGRR